MRVCSPKPAFSLPSLRIQAKAGNAPSFFLRRPAVNYGCRCPFLPSLARSGMQKTDSCSSFFYFQMSAAPGTVVRATPIPTPPRMVDLLLSP